MRHLTSRTLLIPTLMTTGILLAGCGNDEETTRQIEETDTQPVGEFSTDRQASDWQLFLDETQGIYPTEIRSTHQEGFERIIIEHAGSGPPTYTAQYTDDPVNPAPGLPVVTGDQAHLEVLVSNTATRGEIDEDQMLEHNTQITDLDTEATGTVVSFVPVQETSTYVLGLDEERPYAVAILEDPVRVVIDIQLAEHQ